jgi:hypothetical protein
MNAKAVAAVPPVDALPNAARIVADQGQRGQFQALIGAPARAEHRAANAAAHASDTVTSKVKAADDSATTAAAAAVTTTPLPPHAQKIDAAVNSTPASPTPTALIAASLPTLATPNLGALPDAKTLLPVPAAAPALPTGAQAAAATPVLPTSQIAVPLPTTTPDANAAPGNANSPPATQANAANAAAASTPVQSMAAALGLRLVAGASNLPQSPRTPLIDLTTPDKSATAAPTTGSHPALALDMLQGVAKTPVDATPDAGLKLLDVAAKDIVAVQAAPLARDETTPAAADPSPAAAPASLSNDALVAQMTPAPAASAAPTPAASAAPTLMAHAVAEQVAVSLRQAAKSGDDHIQIQLQPAELGAIAVKLNVNHDGRVTMVVSADRSDTLNMLQQDSATLTQALRDAGLQADSSSLSFNLRGFQMNQQASQGGSSWRDTASTSDSDDLGAVPTVASTLRRHSGALDIHV